MRRNRDDRTNRRGELQEVSWRLSFSLEPSAHELDVIRANKLEDEPLRIDGLQLHIRVAELLGRWYEVSGAHSLHRAIAINASLLSSAEGFSTLVAVAAGFEGAHTVEIAS